MTDPQPDCIPRNVLVARLRKAGFTFKRETARVSIFKQRGSLRRVAVHNRRILDSREASAILYQAGLSQEEMAEFLEPYRDDRNR